MTCTRGGRDGRRRARKRTSDRTNLQEPFAKCFVQWRSDDRHLSDLKGNNESNQEEGCRGAQRERLQFTFCLAPCIKYMVGSRQRRRRGRVGSRRGSTDTHKEIIKNRPNPYSLNPDISANALLRILPPRDSDFDLGFRSTQFLRRLPRPENGKESDRFRWELWIFRVSGVFSEGLVLRPSWNWDAVRCLGAFEEEV